MNEERIQEIMKVEQQVQAMQEDARKQAEQLPLQAEQDVKQLLQQTRTQADYEARQIISELREADETGQIQKAAEAASAGFEARARGNFEQAVRFVLDRVAGRK